MPLEKEIDAFLDTVLGTFDARLETTLNGHAVDAYLEGAAQMEEFGKTLGGKSIVFEGPPMKEAIKFANTRAAQAVTQMDTETKRRLANVISNAIEKKRGIPGLARDIRTTFDDMTKYRSKMIARTETANALSAGSIQRMVDMEITGKRWITVGDQDVSDECRANEAQGPISVEDDFTSGVAHPPQHPNCRCAVSPVMLKGKK